MLSRPLFILPVIIIGPEYFRADVIYDLDAA